MYVTTLTYLQSGEVLFTPDGGGGRGCSRGTASRTLTPSGWSESMAAAAAAAGLGGGGGTAGTAVTGIQQASVNAEEVLDSWTWAPPQPGDTEGK